MARLLRACSLIPLITVAVCISAALRGWSHQTHGQTSATPATRVRAHRAVWDLRVTVERFEIVHWSNFRSEAGNQLVFGRWRASIDLSLWPWFIGALLLPVLTGAVRFGRPSPPAAGAFPVRLSRAGAADPEAAQDSIAQV